MPGPTRLPAEIAKARGTHRADRHGDGSFTPEVAVPAAPYWWAEGSGIIEEWERVTAQLFPFGLVTELDRPVLIIYCEAWAEVVDMQALVLEDGPVLESASGRQYPNPAVAMRDAARKTVLEISKRFGFSPSDRTGIKVVSTPKPKSDVEEWSSLKGGK